MAFASAVTRESSGEKRESYGIASAVMNFLNQGGSTTLKTLEDVTLYKNTFMRGADQDVLEKFLNSNNKNSEYALGAVINALSGGVDYSGGANSWDGIDLVQSTTTNSHRDYKWSEDSKTIVEQYRKERNGGVKESSWSYVKKGAQINAIRIVGETLFTDILTGRGEKRKAPLFDKNFKD